MLIPNDTNQYLYDYDFSKFIDCNKHLHNEISKTYNASMKSNLIKKSKLTPCLFELTKVLESMKKRYWLTSGGLLGWYRGCGFTPFSLGIVKIKKS